MSPESTDLRRQFVEADEHGVDALLVALAASAGAEAANSDRLCRSSLEALGSAQPMPLLSPHCSADLRAALCCLPGVSSPTRRC